MKNCKQYRNSLPELALDPQNAPARLQNHVAACTECSESLAALTATLQLMDAWTAPSPSPYFNVRMAARLREERAAEPAGWFELLRTRIQFLSNIQLRPLLAGALATAIMIGGGTFAGLSPSPVAPSATVNDLRLMDRNEQALDQMDRLLEADNETASTTSGNPNSGSLNQ
jgi:hypothetical protein